MIEQAVRDRVQQVLAESLPALCRASLSIFEEVNVDALIGITLNKSEVFLVQINETARGVEESDEEHGNRRRMNGDAREPTNSDDESNVKRRSRKRKSGSTTRGRKSKGGNKRKDSKHTDEPEATQGGQVLNSVNVSEDFPTITDGVDRNNETSKPTDLIHEIEDDIHDDGDFDNDDCDDEVDNTGFADIEGNARLTLGLTSTTTSAPLDGRLSTESNLSSVTIKEEPEQGGSRSKGQPALSSTTVDNDENARDRDKSDDHVADLLLSMATGTSAALDSQQGPANDTYTILSLDTHVASMSRSPKQAPASEEAFDAITKQVNEDQVLLESVDSGELSDAYAMTTQNSSDTEEEKKTDKLRKKRKKKQDGDTKNEMKYACQKCDYKTWHSGNMRRHKAMHENLIQCTICPAKFHSKYALDMHVKFHYNPLRCDHDGCNRKFRSMSGYYKHVQTVHEKKWDYVCKECGKGFASKTHYEGHMSSHTNVKNYECTLCNTKFAYSSNYKRHLLICPHRPEGTPRQTFTCSKCGLDFKSASGLKDHMLGAHTANAMYCKCGRSFKWRGSLFRHKIKCAVFISSKDKDSA